MMRRVIGILAVGLLAACAGLSAKRTEVVTVEDLQRAVGDDWRGQLIYRDYSPPYANVTLDVEAKIAPVPGGISVSLHYPREPHADSVNQIVLSDSGARVNGAQVLSRKQTADALTITTQEACQDDDRPAVCTEEYSLSAARLTWSKKVKFEGEAAITRNTYAFSR